MQYFWKSIKQVICLFFICFAAYILTNAVLIIFHDLALTKLSPLFNLHLPINLDTGTSFSFSDIIFITASLLIGFYIFFRSVESLINEVRFFSSDTITLKTHGNKNIKTSPKEPDGYQPGDILDGTSIGYEPSPPKKEDKKIDKLPAEIVKEKSKNKEEFTKPARLSITNPINSDSTTPPLINVDTAEKAAYILKEVEEAQKEETKKEKKEEPVKTLNILNESKKPSELPKKPEAKHEDENKTKKTKEDPKTISHKESAEEEFIRHPSLKTFFRYVINPSKTVKNNQTLDTSKTKTGSHDEIVHRNIR